MIHHSKFMGISQCSVRANFVWSLSANNERVYFFFFPFCFSFKFRNTTCEKAVMLTILNKIGLDDFKDPMFHDVHSPLVNENWKNIFVSPIVFTQEERNDASSNWISWSLLCSNSRFSLGFMVHYKQSHVKTSFMCCSTYVNLSFLMGTIRGIFVPSDGWSS